MTLITKTDRYPPWRGSLRPSPAPDQRPAVVADGVAVGRAADEPSTAGLERARTAGAEADHAVTDKNWTGVEKLVPGGAEHACVLGCFGSEYLFIFYTDSACKGISPMNLIEPPLYDEDLGFRVRIGLVLRSGGIASLYPRLLYYALSGRVEVVPTDALGIF